MKLAPFRFAPAFFTRIWGSRSLEPLFPEAPESEEPIGEAWLTGNDCIIATGHWSGHKLGEAWPQIPAEWTGTRLAGLAQMPLLVKFIFPAERLSVQVHPPDEYAEKHEQAAGGVGKTEMWYAVSARPSAQVMVGLKRGVTAESFRRAIEDGAAEECVEHIPIRAGEAIFVPAGTVHTIGPGLVLCEIQENSDLTYRVYDYNRLDTRGKPRPLHLKKAFDVINFGPQHGGRIEPLSVEHGGVKKTYYAACRYFATERWEFSKKLAAQTSPGHFDLMIVLEGRGRLTWPEGEIHYEPAQVWFVPAALGAYKWEPAARTTILRTFVPDVERDFVQPLREQQVEEGAWARLVHL